MKRLILTGILGMTLVALAGCDIVLGVGCEYGDDLYSTGDSFTAEDGCNTCTCDAGGTVSCSAMDCADSCEYDGEVYQVGDKIGGVFDCGPNVYCTCEPGGAVVCPDFDCLGDCLYHGEIYAAGSSFPAIDSCNTCYCVEGGGVSCTEIGCPLPAPGFEKNQTRFGGCGDMWAYSSNEHDSTSIGLRLEEVVSRAFAQQTDVTYEYDLPSDEVELTVLVGRNLTINYCNDVIEDYPEVVRTMHASAGHLTVTITRTGDLEPWELPAYADILLQNVVFDDVDGYHSVTVEHFEMNDVSVGWFPG